MPERAFRVILIMYRKRERMQAGGYTCFLVCMCVCVYVRKGNEANDDEGKAQEFNGMRRGREGNGNAGAIEQVFNPSGNHLIPQSLGSPARQSFLLIWLYKLSHKLVTRRRQRACKNGIKLQVQKERTRYPITGLQENQTRTPASIPFFPINPLAPHPSFLFASFSACVCV